MILRVYPRSVDVGNAVDVVRDGRALAVVGFSPSSQLLGKLLRDGKHLQGAEMASQINIYVTDERLRSIVMVAELIRTCK